jgi:TerC family integral membrane protein
LVSYENMTVNEFVIFVAFLALIVIMLMIDIGIFHKKDHEVGYKEALIMTSIWVLLALATWLLIYFFGDKIHGPENYKELAELVKKYGHPTQLIENNFEASLPIYRKNLALEFITGYVVEYSLSLDNIFVFVMIFISFGIQKKYYHRILFWGILGAIIMRFLFIFISSALIQQFDWILVLFGLLLIFTGTKMFLDRNKKHKIDTARHPVIRFTARFFAVDKDYAGPNFFIRINGKLFITSLLIVLLVIEFSDVIFAVDSVPAIFSITKDPYIVYFSNIFAIIGLRSLFFLLINILGKFRFLHTGLSFLLAFVGAKMILHYFHWLDISTIHSLVIILGIILISILASVIIPTKEKTTFQNS